MNCKVNEEDKYTNIENVIKNISLERNYKSHDFKIIFKFAKGENYLGDIERATLKGVNENGDVETLNLIIKTPPPNVREEFPVNVYYERELFAYNIFLPTLTQMQDGLNIPQNEKIRFAKLYGGSAENINEVLIFEDLNCDGYKMYDRLKSLDYDHLMVAIKTIAIYHAYSFAAKHLIPELYTEAIANSFGRDDLGKSFGEAFEQCKTKSISVIKNEEHRQRVAKYSEGGIFDKLLDILDAGATEELPYNIICHGDCWINNCLFEYDENGKPAKMVLIDWQMNNYSSPVTDLAYLIFSSTDETIRSKYWDEIFETYYDTLKVRLDILQCDINICYPEEIFKQHIKEKLQIGLVWSFMLVPIVLNNKDAAMDLNDFIADDGSNKIESIQYSQDCIERLNGIVGDFVKLSYI